MIKTQIFTVTGNTDVTDDIIFCRRLEFVLPGAQLVIKPKPGAPSGAPRILKIVANVISTTLAGGTGEITYNLDGDFFPSFELPAGDLGLDPETQAKTGDDGKPSYNLGPLPPADIAAPHHDPILDPLHYVGSYPKATNGGNGEPGGRGDKGVNGANAPILEIWTTEISGNLVIDLRGQKGGIGGNGGNGQGGGNGQMGAAAATGTDETWLGIPNLTCAQKPGLGGDGGKGGNAGCGGDGGDGGNGGTFKLFYTPTVNLSNVTTKLDKGTGGQPGNPGMPGKGGKSGPPGVNIPPCVPALTSQDGTDGSRCTREGDKEGGIAQNGADGTDGKYHPIQIQAIPQMPGLWP